MKSTKTLYSTDSNNKIVFGFYSKQTDSIHSCEYTKKTNTLQIYKHATLNKLSIALMGNNRTLKQTSKIPCWTLSFNPTQQPLKPLDHKTNTINLFNPSKLLTNPKQFSSTIPTYNTPQTSSKTLKHLCPTIHLTLKNACGVLPHDLTTTEFNHFLNWLAYILQTRKKTNRAWLLQGTPQSGKSTIITKILSPILSPKHVQMVQCNQINDKFNTGTEQTLIVGLAEIKPIDSTTKAALRSLKNMITESELSIRSIRQNRTTITSYSNFIFCTSYRNSLDINTGEEYKFNICPYQRHSIPQILKNLPQILTLPKGTTYEEAIDKELPTLTSYLLNYQTDKFAASTALTNKAKELAIEEAKPLATRFINAIHNGDFRWLIDNLPTVEDIRLRNPEQFNLSFKLNVLKNGIEILNNITHQKPLVRKGYAKTQMALDREEGVSVSTRDLSIIYTALNADNKLTTKREFHALLKKDNLNYKQTTRGGIRGRFLESYIRWNITESDIAILNEITLEHYKHKPNLKLLKGL